MTKTLTSDEILGETCTEELVLRLQRGEEGALDALWTRYTPRLRRWAHGRLSPGLRDQTSTDDLVQDAFLRSLTHLKKLEPRGQGSVFRYFRTIVLNQIRDYARQTACRPRRDVVDWDARIHPGPSPLEQVLGQELVERYESALERLPEEDQQLVLAYVELRCSDRELAELFEKPSPDAARMARGRALGRLARAMAPAGRA